MAKVEIMPKLGFNMNEGKLVSWKKKEGDKVEKGEVLFEVLTDKVTMEIEATETGYVLSLLVDEGEVVPVTQPIAIIGEKDEDISALKEELKIKPEEEVKEEEVKIKISPRAKKLAEKLGLDISSIKPNPEGIIRESDVKEFHKKLSTKKVTPAAKKLAEENNIDYSSLEGTGPGGRITKQDIEKLVKKEPKEPVESRKTIPYDGMRRIIGERLSQSKFTAPHIYFTIKVDMSKLIELKKDLKDQIESLTGGYNASLNDYIVFAVSKTLKEFPLLNSSLMGDEILIHDSINIGIAVAVENGLVVPVVKDTQDKKFTDIVKDSKELIEKARAKRLTPDDYSGGTFTISNLGMWGIEQFTAIINPPESAILAVGKIIKTPIVEETEEGEKVMIKPIMKVTLSVDHRVIDGAVAAQFLNKLKDFLEKPSKMFL
ncbi:MAG: hypothetical protein PWQ82_1464 [Thermosediminibacterales bacterium]|nr:hypothetical protein [Thermosediminibacterales bacterium]MDK2836905.1 hypothetical protein [Thermosediminibacterales bacterium]